MKLFRNVDNLLHMLLNAAIFIAALCFIERYAYKLHYLEERVNRIAKVVNNNARAQRAHATRQIALEEAIVDKVPSKNYNEHIDGDIMWREGMSAILDQMGKKFDAKLNSAADYVDRRFVQIEKQLSPHVARKQEETQTLGQPLVRYEDENTEKIRKKTMEEFREKLRKERTEGNKQTS